MLALNYAGSLSRLLVNINFQNRDSLPANDTYFVHLEAHVEKVFLYTHSFAEMNI